MPTTNRTNNYSGICRTCQREVPAQTGVIERSATGRWVVRHYRRRLDNACIVRNEAGTWVEVAGPVATFTPGASPVPTMVDANLSSTINLHELPRPSRDSLSVLSSRTDGIFFRIWRSRMGRTIVYYSRSAGGRGPAIAIQDGNESAMRWRISDATIRAAFEAVMADPMRALEHYGIVTSRCGHCGRRLTNPESVLRGIGPVCYARALGQRWYYGTQATTTAPRTIDQAVVDHLLQPNRPAATLEQNRAGMAEARVLLDQLGGGEVL